MACAYVVNSPALQDDHEPEVLSVDVPIARALLIVELAALRCHVLGVGGERNEHDGHERTKGAAELFEGLPPMGATRASEPPDTHDEGEGLLATADTRR